MPSVRDVRFVAVVAALLPLAACTASGAPAPSTRSTPTPAPSPSLTTAGAVAAWRDIDRRVNAVEALRGKDLAAWDTVEGGVINPFLRIGSLAMRDPKEEPNPPQVSTVLKSWPAPAAQRTAVTLTRMKGGRSIDGQHWMSVLRQDGPKSSWREIAAGMVDAPPAVGEPMVRAVTPTEEKQVLVLTDKIRARLFEPPASLGVTPAKDHTRAFFDSAEWKKMCEEGAPGFQCTYGNADYYAGKPTQPLVASPALQLVATTNGVLAFASYTVEETGRYPGQETKYPESYQPFTGPQWVDHLSYTHGVVIGLFLPKAGKPIEVAAAQYQGGPTGHPLR